MTELVVVALAAVAVVLFRAVETEGWFAFEPEEDFSESVLDASGWLDAPAGKHGRVRVDGEKLVFSDGTPVKFWGANICNARVAPDARTARRWARFLAKYGMNAVRFHKWTWPGDQGIGNSRDSTRVVASKRKRMDAFVARLRERGVYYGWSHIYGHRLAPGDRRRVLAYDEVASAGSRHLKGSTIGLVHFAEDLQDLSIELTVGLLEHENPCTGLRYADDPALAFIELQNEDDIFFGTTMQFVEQCPTYKELFCRLFSDWLAERYPTHDALVAAWGAEAIDAYPEFRTGEHLDRRNLYPIANPWYYSPAGLAHEERTRKARRRLLDTARFLYETQNHYYDRYIRAIRATGYQGPIVASCWQAGSGISHYYNLHSDARAGLVDRHNYFGGRTGHEMVPGEVATEAMVQQPGSGLLATGMQQVAGHPFAISEWISKLPNQWVAEGAPIIAAYGLGLQDWDASYAFATNYDRMTGELAAPNTYNVNSPLQAGLYPALARMIYRGDVAPGEVVSVRKVSLPALAEGELGFVEDVRQEGDDKTISGDVPPEALGVGRVLVEFVDSYEKTPPPQLDAHWDKLDRVVRSTTDQLTWHYGTKGYFTIDTPGTQGLVGFAPAERVDLSVVRLRVETPFVVLLVSSLDRTAGIREADRLLITAVARARNTGQRYNESGSELLDAGGPPILLEPVTARIGLDREGSPVVRVLDHVGRRTDRTAEFDDGQVRIDGREYRTLYYELDYHTS